ncbi:hypothetical protein MNEG_13256, partial [Monoraphidium neglectum]
MKQPPTSPEGAARRGLHADDSARLLCTPCPLASKAGSGAPQLVLPDESADAGAHSAFSSAARTSSDPLPSPPLAAGAPPSPRRRSPAGRRE